MKQILKYLLFLIIGIIFYILVNSKDNFSVGIVRYSVVWGEEGSAAAREQFDSKLEAENFYTEYHLDDYTYPNMAIYRVNDDGTQEYIEPPRQPSRTAQEGIQITISIISETFQLQVPTAYTLQQFQEMINLERQFPPNFDGYRLMLNGTGGLFLDEVMDTLFESITNLRQHYVDYRQENFPTFTALWANRSRVNDTTTQIENRIRQINNCMTEIQNYVRNITMHLGQRYTALYTQILGRNQSIRPYRRPENVRYDNLRYTDVDAEPEFLLNPEDVLEYIYGTESEKDRFDRVLALVNTIISENIGRINNNKLRYRQGVNYKQTEQQQQILDSIQERFENIDRLLTLLFNMLNDMFTLEPTLVDVLEYYQIELNGLTLVLRLVCASEGVPPSID